MKLSALVLGAAFGWVLLAIVALAKNVVNDWKTILKGYSRVNNSPPEITVNVLTLSFGAAALGTVAWILILCGQ